MGKSKTRGHYRKDSAANSGKHNPGAGDGKRGVTRSVRKVGRR